MYREYEALKNKHDVQSRVMEDAMKSASQVTCHGCRPAPQDVSAVDVNESSCFVICKALRAVIFNSRPD
jgi:hypothetical protein